MNFHLLQKGSYGASQNTKAEVFVVDDAARYRTLWAAHVGPTDPPVVDFAKESAVFLVLGARRSGGFDIVPSEVVLDGDSATIDATVNTPGPRAIVATVMTAPFAVIAVQHRHLHNAKWMSRKRLVADSSAPPAAAPAQR